MAVLELLSELLQLIRVRVKFQKRKLRLEQKRGGGLFAEHCNSPVQRCGYLRDGIIKAFIRCYQVQYVRLVEQLAVYLVVGVFQRRRVVLIFQLIHAHVVKLARPVLKAHHKE